jgi:hypothetical protein
MHRSIRNRLESPEDRRMETNPRVFLWASEQRIAWGRPLNPAELSDREAREEKIFPPFTRGKPSCSISND